MIEKEMILMNAMRTENNLDITEEQILNSLDTFIDKPVILNKKQEMKDYRIKEKDLKQLNKERTIGIIKTVRYDKNTKQVVGIVHIYKNKDYYKYFKLKYDNWQITFENSVNDNKFEFIAVELF